MCQKLFKISKFLYKLWYKLYKFQILEKWSLPLFFFLKSFWTILKIPLLTLVLLGDDLRGADRGDGEGDRGGAQARELTEDLHCHWPVQVRYISQK